MDKKYPVIDSVTIGAEVFKKFFWIVTLCILALIAGLWIMAVCTSAEQRANYVLRNTGYGKSRLYKAMSLSISAPLAFIISFYSFLVGANIVVAIFIGKSKSFLKGNVYIYTLRFLGLVLFVLAIVLFNDGLKLLKII